MSETMKQTDLIFLLTRYLSFSRFIRRKLLVQHPQRKAQSFTALAVGFTPCQRRFPVYQTNMQSWNSLELVLFPFWPWCVQISRTPWCETVEASCSGTNEKLQRPQSLFPLPWQWKISPCTSVISPFKAPHFLRDVPGSTFDFIGGSICHAFCCGASLEQKIHGVSPGAKNVTCCFRLPCTMRDSPNVSDKRHPKSTSFRMGCISHAQMVGLYGLWHGVYHIK